MEYTIYIYFPLFGVPTLAHKHVMDQRSGVAFGVETPVSWGFGKVTRRWTFCIAGVLVPHVLPGDFLGCYLFIFVHICQTAFLGIYDILHVLTMYFCWRILKLRTLQPLLCTDSMLSTCETGFRGDMLAGGKLGLEPILAAARIAGMGQQSWLLTNHWYNNIYIYIIILYIYIHIYIHICTYLSYPILSYPIPSDPIRSDPIHPSIDRSIYLSIYLFAIWWVISPKLWLLTVRDAHFAGTLCAGEMRISRFGAKPRLGKLSCINMPMILQESQNCFGKIRLNHWNPQYLAGE